MVSFDRNMRVTSWKMLMVNHEKMGEEVYEQSLVVSVGLLAVLAEVGAAADFHLVVFYPLNFDLSVELVLGEGVVVALGKDFDDFVFGVAFSAGWELVDLEVIAHGKQKEI